MATLDKLKDSPIGPILSLFFDEPELRGLLERIAADQDKGDYWSADKFFMELRGTGWWKKTTQSQQEWKTLSHAEQQKRGAAVRAELTSEYQSQFGLSYLQDHPIPEHDLHNLSARVASGEMPIEVARMRILNAALKREGTQAWLRAAQERRARQRPEEIAEELSQRAMKDYLVFGTSPTSIRKWAEDINAGRMSEADFNQFLRDESKRVFSRQAEAIDRGILPRDFMAPVLNWVGQTLEQDPDQLIGKPEMFGQIAQQMAEAEGWNMNDWIKYAKSLPEWQTTHNAYKTYSRIGSYIAEKFGAQS